MTDQKLRAAAEHLGENVLWLIKQVLLKHDMAVIEASKEAIDDAVAAEREACALLVEQAGIDGYGTLAAAALIRRRADPK
jgi:H2-forming N5,N10-methylenetetrahydromethanopterin dehydrogenase-like enzyme